MKTTKQTLSPLHSALSPVERFSLRVQDDVEIYEHEVIYSPEPAKLKAPAPPRLVVSDYSQRPVLTRSRSEIDGLRDLIRSLSFEPLEAK